MAAKGPGLRTYLLFILFVAVVLFRQLIVQPQATDDRSWQADWGSSGPQTATVEKSFDEEVKDFNR